jgi:hypothetical protein
MATKKAAKKSKKVAPKKAAAESAGGGRTSSYAGLKITKLVKDNPRREGTHGHKSFSLITNGMTYEKFIEAGGRRVDLDYDVKKGNLKIA